jgi:hypothetical protein
MEICQKQIKMRKPEKSKKRRLAATKRAKKRAKRNTAKFKKMVANRREHIIRMKQAEKRKLDQHLENLLGR